MIHVARQPEPAALERKNRQGKHKGKSEREIVLAALEEHLAAGKTRDSFSYAFKVYKDDEVKTTLDANFAGKCAYCETFYSASQPMDVEHWRPKGEVHDEGEVLKPGYYWLAADWRNLFPSCIDCNRARKQFDVLERREILQGKANQFPLAKKETRILDHTREREIADEAVLLLDPCTDDPEQFFVYSDEGAILPRDGISSLERQRALASIRVYALNRSALVAERREVIQRFFHRLRLLDRLADLRLELNARGQADLAELVAELIGAETRALDEMVAASRPFAGLARFLIRGRPPRRR